MKGTVLEFEIFKMLFLYISKPTEKRFAFATCDFKLRYSEPIMLQT